MPLGVKGQPKVPGSGRKKGTKNRVNRDLHALCEEMGVDPFKRILALCMDPDKGIQMSALNTAIKYLYPQLKASEVTAMISAEVGEKIREIEEMSREDQIRMLEDNLKSLKSNQ